MALEQVFECPRTLRRLRSDPLGKLLEGFCNWLLEHGFSRGAIRKHLFNVSHLNEYLGGPRSRPHQGVSLREVEGFFKAYPLQCVNRRVAGEASPSRPATQSIGLLDYLRQSRGFLILCGELADLSAPFRRLSPVDAPLPARLRGNA